MNERVLVSKNRRNYRIVRDEPQSRRIPTREECSKCRGSGKRSVKKGHKPDCACVGCKPCKDCNGTGRVEGVQRGRRKDRNVEVEFADERDLGTYPQDDGD